MTVSRKKLIEVALRIGAGEVDPARAPQRLASLVGAPAPGRGAGGDLCADGGRSGGLPRGVPH